MKTLLVFASSLLVLCSFSSEKALPEKSLQPGNGSSNIDTLAMLHITDSIAAVELQKYDEQSQRQTGVPKSVPHFDKIFTANTTQTVFIVHYSFNQKKFYGKNWDEKNYPITTGFPDHFSVSYDLVTKKITVLYEG